VLDGVDGHLHLGCDVPGTLTRVLDRAGCAKGSEAL
jgi:hypothetical protein